MRKICKNTQKKTYTGNENTPLGRGYHASAEKIGSKMRGKDKKMYQVIKTKVGKRWQVVTKKPTTKKNRRGTMSTFNTDYEMINQAYEPDEDELEALERKRKSDKSAQEILAQNKNSDKCEYLNKNLSNQDYAKRDQYIVKMTELVDGLGLDCSEENKKVLIERLSCQYDSPEAAKKGIENLLDNYSP